MTNDVELRLEIVSVEWYFECWYFGIVDGGIKGFVGRSKIGNWLRLDLIDWIWLDVIGVQIEEDIQWWHY